MGFFECCHHCTKRYPGCHDKCPDYIEHKKLWEKCKDAEKLRRSEESASLKTYIENAPLRKYSH